MGRNKGTIKTGGRTKGTPNKTTQEIRDLFKNLLASNLNKLQKDLDQMKPEQRVRTLLELSKFVIPTLRATEHSGEINSKQENIIRINFKD